MDGSAADPLAGLAGEGQGTPLLALDGYTGPLQRLLTLARTQRIDLARLPLGDLVDQLVVALQQAPPATPLGQKGDWVVMTAWLVQLRSLLLLPVDHPAHRAAEAEADQLRERLVTLREMQALGRGGHSPSPSSRSDVLVSLIHRALEGESEPKNP